MLRRFVKCLPLGTMVSGAALLLVMPASPAWGQSGCCPTPYSTFPQPSPAPAPAPSGQAPARTETQPSTQPSTQPEQEARAPQVNPSEQGLSPERSAAVGGQLFAQNMIGDAGFVGDPPALERQEGALGEPDGDEGPLALSNAATVAARLGAFKITENESPRPQDRVYLDYNFFSNVQQVGTDVHREMFGFEKTLLDGDASIGMRLPFFQKGNHPDNLPDIGDVGDLDLLTKYAWINNSQTGNVLSTGLAVSFPTGKGIPITGESTIHDVLFQPWVGGIYNFGDLYVQGFSAIIVPTDSRDITILFNDVAFGYWLYRGNGDRLLTSIVPAFETHVNTPLNHRGINPDSLGLGLQDSVVLTAGTHFGLGERSTLLLGVAAPVSNPKPFDVEGIVQFNLRF